MKIGIIGVGLMGHGIASNLLKEGDVTILGVRYSDTSTTNTTSLLVNSRYPVNSAWRVNPRVRLDYRENLTDESTQWTAAPSLLLDYRWHRKYRLEFEAGGEWSSRELQASGTTTTPANSASVRQRRVPLGGDTSFRVDAG